MEFGSIFSRKEISKHNCYDNAWVIYKNNVIDVTPLLSEDDKIIKYFLGFLGKDITLRAPLPEYNEIRQFLEDESLQLGMAHPLKSTMQLKIDS